MRVIERPLKRTMIASAAVIAICYLGTLPMCAGQEPVRPLRPPVRNVIPPDPPLDKLHIAVEIAPVQQAPDGILVSVQLINKERETIELVDPATTSMIEVTTGDGRVVTMPLVPRQDSQPVRIPAGSAGYRFTATMKDIAELDNPRQPETAPSATSGTMASHPTRPVGSAPPERKPLTAGRYSVRIIIGLAIFPRSAEEATRSRLASSTPVTVQYME